MTAPDPTEQRRPDPERSRPVLSEPWAVDAAVKIAELRHSARTAATDPPASGTPERRKAALDAVEELLENADRAVRRRHPLLPRGPLDRWRGTSVATAYQNLHTAEVFLVDLLSNERLGALVPTVVARVQTVLDPADPRRAAIDQLPQQPSTLGPEARAAIQQAMRIGFDATDQLHVRVRNFRNLLIRCAVVILAMMAVLALLVALGPEAMPMCFAKKGSSPLNICPSGQNHPSGGDVLIVTGLGLLGGALAAAFSIRNVRGTSTPYDVPVALAMLKPPLGALTAVSSIVLLGGDFVPGLSQLDSQRQILAYALVFGYAQQLVSRLIDNQGRTILNSLPSKDPQAKKPEASMVSVSSTAPPATQGAQGPVWP